MRALLAWLLASTALVCAADPALKAPPPPPPLPQVALPLGWSAQPPILETINPGREEPKQNAHSGAIEIDWGDYRTFLVIGPGSGRLRPAWVLTYQRGADLSVAYRGVAFRDRFGVLHLDARNALVVGAQAESWSPDSFAVFANGKISTLDDQGSSEQGVVARTIDGDTGEFHGLLILAETLVNGDS